MQFLVAFWDTIKPIESPLSPKNQPFFLSFLTTWPFLTPLKRLTVCTFNSMNSQLAVSQFSPILTSHDGTLLPRLAHVLLEQMLLLSLSHWLHLAWSKKKGRKHNSRPHTLCPATVLLKMSGILQTIKTASTTTTLVLPGHSGSSLAVNISPYCFCTGKVVTEVIK